MNEAAIYEKLTAIFHDIFDDESIALTASTQAADVPGWDSFAHINVIVATEMKFGVKFTTGEVESMKRVGDLVRMLQAKQKT